MENSPLPLHDATVREILLHREIHFGGKFSLMIEYYQMGGRGVSEDFSLQKIQELAQLEEEAGENLAPLVLTGADAELVAKGRKAYQRLKEMYEKAKGKSSPATKIADLILAENECPEEEIEAIAQENREVMIPLLLDLLQDPEWHDPLSPGYGTVPGLVAQCLQKMGDDRSIATLFESIGRGSFYDDEQIFIALRALGEPAKQFVLRLLKSKPLREDNHRAALCLAAFPEDETIGKTCLDLLQDPAFRNDPTLAPYLLYATEGLAHGKHKKEWLDFLEKGPLPEFLEPDVKMMRKRYG